MKRNLSLNHITVSAVSTNQLVGQISIGKMSLGQMDFDQKIWYCFGMAEALFKYVFTKKQKQVGSVIFKKSTQLQLLSLILAALPAPCLLINWQFVNKALKKLLTQSIKWHYELCQPNNLQARYLLAKWFLTKRCGTVLLWQYPNINMASREYKRGKYHCTIDLLFDWFGLVCFANKNKNC